MDVSEPTGDAAWVDSAESGASSGSCFCLLSASTVAWGTCLNVRVVSVWVCMCCAWVSVGGCEGQRVMHQGVKVGWSVCESVSGCVSEQLERGICECVSRGVSEQLEWGICVCVCVNEGVCVCRVWFV